MQSEVFFICSRGGYTIFFLPGVAEVTTSAIGCWENKWYFKLASPHLVFVTRAEGEEFSRYMDCPNFFHPRYVIYYFLQLCVNSEILSA